MRLKIDDRKKQGAALNTVGHTVLRSQLGGSLGGAWRPWPAYADRDLGLCWYHLCCIARNRRRGGLGWVHWRVVSCVVPPAVPTGRQDTHPCTYEREGCLMALRQIPQLSRAPKGAESSGLARRVTVGQCPVRGRLRHLKA